MSDVVSAGPSDSDGPAAAGSRSTSRQRALQLAQQVAALEAENERLRELSVQWVMHHAHAAYGIQRVREAIAAGKTDPAELMQILNESDVNAGTERFSALLVDRMVLEWTREPIPTVTRSTVRDWLIAHRTPRL